MIVEHIIRAALHEFAAELDHLKSIMARVSNDGRERSYKDGVPSNDAVRSFRARHRELTYRNTENKELSKWGEEYVHVQTYELF